ncbi:hypothetical protein D0N50_07235 [Erwinia billingiae]|uniref:hypothetical protein n=1 Tax=Erwinia billingiae TaxID=182337 RepID=UPI001247979A|nr:hypothetical protein [Erwinia billingiae]QEW31485.1 hypothetical protein D0N50_07235 [Erwinia billingiae]
MQKYTNSITPSAFALFKGLYSVERTANADGEQRQIFESYVEEMKDCSLVAIWRFATAASLSLNGGKVEQCQPIFSLQ